MSNILAHSKLLVYKFPLSMFVHQKYSNFSTDCVVSESSYTIDFNRRLTINWEFKAQKYNICDTFYNVVVKLTMLTCTAESCIDTSTIVPVVDRAFSFADQLEFCESYQYEIVHDWQPSDGTVVERVANIYPNTAITLEEINDNRTLRVNWTYPENPSCPKKFVTEIRQEDVVKNKFESSVFYEIIDNLEACDTYTITVFPDIPDATPGTYGDTLEHTMSFAFPSSLRNMNATYIPEDNTVSVNWVAPLSGSKCIEYYQIAATSSNDNQFKTTVYINEIIQNVFACESYVFNVSIRTITNIDVPGASRDLLIPSRSKFPKREI